LATDSDANTLSTTTSVTSQELNILYQRMDGQRGKSMTDCLLKQKRLIYAKETTREKAAGTFTNNFGAHYDNKNQILRYLNYFPKKKLGVVKKMSSKN
jgi:hypothetical protein